MAWLTCSTTNSDIEIALAARHALPPGTAVEHADTEGRSVRRFRLDLRSGHSQVVDKIVALYTGHDRAIADPRDAAVEHARTAPAFDQLVADQRAAWRDLWRRAELDVPNKAGLILRLHLFQVLQTLSPHTAELDAASPPGDCTARPTAATSSGTNSSSCATSTSTSPRSPAPC
ncbi:hypothetical protein ACFQVA_39955 [Actinomadura keratinilytica]